MRIFKLLVTAPPFSGGLIVGPGVVFVAVAMCDVPSAIAARLWLAGLEVGQVTVNGTPSGEVDG